MKSPGILYYSIEGEEFYVDLLWAIAIESRAKLNRILKLKQPFFGKELVKISNNSVMRKTYTIAKFLVKLDKNTKKKNSHFRKFIRWYYYYLSPKLVDYLLNYPKINRFIRKILEGIFSVVIYFFKLKLLSSKEIIETKRILGYQYKDGANCKIQNIEKRKRKLKRG